VLTITKIIRKTASIIGYYLLLTTLSATIYGQNSDDQLTKPIRESTINYKNTSIGLSFDLGSSYFHNAPVVLTNCDNCSSENQRAKIVLRPEFRLAHRINKNHEIHFGFGITQFGFIEDIFTVDRNIKDRSKHFDFYSIALGHGFILKENERFRLALINQLITDIYFESHLWLIRRENFSIRSSMLFTWKVSEKVSFELFPFIKQSMRAYNRIVFDKNYWPYTIGIGVGFKYSFKDVK